MSRFTRQHLWISGGILAFSVLMIGVLGYGLKIDTSKVPPANIDKEALPFTVSFVQGKDLVPQSKDGEHFSLADFKGRPVILNFWASWCVSCREEAHEMEKFWEAHKTDVAVIGIAIQDQKVDAKKFADYFGKTYILGLDDTGNAGIDYGVSGVPETFFIDRAGVIRHKEIGPVDMSLLEKFMPKIM